MDRDDEYRARAEEARREAENSISELDRERWLAIMRGWLGLIRNRPQSDKDDKSA